LRERRPQYGPAPLASPPLGGTYLENCIAAVGVLY
jgi:hypothetical protein